MGHPSVPLSPVGALPEGHPHPWQASLSPWAPTLPGHGQMGSQIWPLGLSLVQLRPDPAETPRHGRSMAPVRLSVSSGPPLAGNVSCRRESRDPVSVGTREASVIPK